MCEGKVDPKVSILSSYARWLLLDTEDNVSKTLEVEIAIDSKLHSDNRQGVCHIQFGHLQGKVNEICILLTSCFSCFSKAARSLTMALCVPRSSLFCSLIISVRQHISVSTTGIKTCCKHVACLIKTCFPS